MSIVLNMSIFIANFKDNLPEAIKLCERTISDSQDKIEELSDEEFKESKLIVVKLKDNIKMWNEQLKKK